MCILCARPTSTSSQAASVVGCEDCQPRESIKPACFRLGGQCPCCWCKHKLVDLKQAGVAHELTCAHCQAAGAQRREKRLQSTGLTYRYTLVVGDGHISEFSVTGKTKALDTGKSSLDRGFEGYSAVQACTACLSLAFNFEFSTREWSNAKQFKISKN